MHALATTSGVFRRSCRHWQKTFYGPRRVAVVLLFTLLLFGDPLACVLHCRISPLFWSNGGNLQQHQHPHESMTLVPDGQSFVDDVKEDLPQSSSPLFGATEEHEHLAALGLLVFLVLIWGRLERVVLFVPRPPTRRSPPRYRPPIGVCFFC